MSGFSFYAVVRNLVMQSEKLLFACAVLLLVLRLWPRFKKTRFVERLTTWGLGLSLAFLAAVSVAPLDRAVELAAGPPGTRFERGLQSGCVVVLGGGLDGATLLSRGSRQRTEAGVSVMKACGARLLVMSGGDPMGLGGTEAAAMKAYALTLGVPEDRIAVEGRSVNTHENAVFTADMLRARGIPSAVIVTGPTQARRAYLCFRKAGVETLTLGVGDSMEGGGPKIPVNLRKLAICNSLLYEGFGFLFYEIRGWI